MRNPGRDMRRYWMIFVMFLAWLAPGMALRAAGEKELLRLTGTVEVRRGNQDLWGVIFSSAPVQDDDWARTHEASLGELDFHGGKQVAKLYERTVVQVGKVERERVTLKAIVGRLRASVRHFLGKGMPMEIQTPSAAVAIRGSEVDLVILPDGTTLVIVGDGIVEVTANGVTLFLHAGESAVISPGRNPRLVGYSSRLAFGDSQDRWGFEFQGDSVREARLPSADPPGFVDAPGMLEDSVPYGRGFDPSWGLVQVKGGALTSGWPVSDQQAAPPAGIAQAGTFSSTTTSLVNQPSGPVTKTLAFANFSVSNTFTFTGSLFSLTFSPFLIPPSPGDAFAGSLSGSGISGTLSGTFITPNIASVTLNVSGTGIASANGSVIGQVGLLDLGGVFLNPSLAGASQTTFPVALCTGICIFGIPEGVVVFIESSATFTNFLPKANFSASISRLPLSGLGILGGRVSGNIVGGDLTLTFENVSTDISGGLPNNVLPAHGVISAISGSVIFGGGQLP